MNSRPKTFAEAEAARDSMVQQFGAVVGEQVEVEHLELDESDRPHKGEWLRANVMRKEMEATAKAQMEAVPNIDQFFVPYQLRGERILAVPVGAAGVAFIWKMDGTKQ